MYSDSEREDQEESPYLEETLKNTRINRMVRSLLFQQTPVRTDRPYGVAVSKHDQMPTIKRTQTVASPVHQIPSPTKQDGTRGAKHASNHLTQSQSTSTHYSGHLAGPPSKTSLPALESPCEKNDRISELQKLIKHIETENTELRQCCRNQAINLREQEVVLHAQMGAQMKRQMEDAAVRPTAALRFAKSATRVGKRQARGPKTRPKTIRRNGSLPHAFLKPAEMSVCLPNLHPFITSMITQLAKIDSTPPGTVQNLSNLRHQELRSAKSIFTTLHFLFPHELLPALDLLDRKLVNQVVVIPSTDPNRSTEAVLPAESSVLASATPQPPRETFYVQSASATAPSSKSNSRYRRVFNPTGTYYEVRLDAWNCTCPAFAYSAFGRTLDLGHDQASMQERTHQIEPETELSGSQWRFGGTATRAGTGAPICKHILAAMLGQALPGLFGNGVEKKEVTAAEAAGWSGGWGD